MAAEQLEKVLDYVYRIAGAKTPRGPTDAHLLERFALHKDQTAFADLVRRHGPRVWNVCRRVLGHHQDAEDAFQVTFLVLARKAPSVRKKGSVAAWLHGAAYRSALEIRRKASRRHKHESKAPLKTAAGAESDIGWREVQAILEEEVQRLPEKYRVPFMLCCLDGQSKAEAAFQLGWKEGTLSGRLAEARKRLQERLARRGITLSAVLGGMAVAAGSNAAALPAGMVTATINAGAQWAAGMGGIGGFVSAEVVAGAKAVMAAMGAGRRVLTVLLVLFLSAGVAGTGLVLGKREPGKETLSRPGVEKPQPTVVEQKPPTDLHGDPLPRGSLARLGTLRGRAPGSAIAVTADGKEVVAVGPDLIVRRFDALTGEIRSTRLLPCEPSSRFLRLSPKGTFGLVSRELPGTNDCKMELWDLSLCKLSQELPITDSWPSGWGVTISHDETLVGLANSARVRNDGKQRVLIWDLKTGKSRVLWTQEKEISSTFYYPIAIFSPDGRRLAVAHLDMILRCWDVADGKLLWEEKEKTRSPFILFSRDGQTILTPGQVELGSHLRGCYLRDAASGKPLKWKGPLPPETVFPVTFSSDGSCLAYANLEGELVVWNMEAGKVLHRFPPPSTRNKILGQYIPVNLLTDVAFMPDGKSLIRRAGGLQRWDLSTDKPLLADTELWGHSEGVNRLVFSPNSRLLASSSLDGTARLWDTATSRPLHSIPIESYSPYLAFTPDSRQLLTMPWGRDPRKTPFQFWDVKSGGETRTLTLGDSTFFLSGHGEVQVTPDGRRVLALSCMPSGPRNENCYLTIWELPSGQCLRHERVPWPEEGILTPDGTGVIMVDTKTGEVKFLDVEKGQPRLSFAPEKTHGPGGRVWDFNLALSPNGGLVAFCIDTPNIRKEHGDLCLGDLTTGQMRSLPLKGPAVCAFSADNRLLAVAVPNGIHLFEVASGQSVGTLPAIDPAAVVPGRPCATALAFSPDGRILASGHADSTILFWDPTLRAGAHGGPLDDAQVKACWNDLASTDAARAYAAIWRLVEDPGRAVPLLREHFKFQPAPGPEELRRLVADLDADEFDKREAAEKKLRAFGGWAEAALRAGLKDNPSPEQKRRIEGILAALRDFNPPAPETLRRLRAVMVLERAGTAEAQKLLQALAKGSPEARLAREAKAALDRLNRCLGVK